MTFNCECGFHAELSAKQLDRIAASGGRVKCPKCGKRSELSGEKGTKKSSDTPPAIGVPNTRATTEALFDFGEVVEPQPMTDTIELEAVDAASTETSMEPKKWDTKDWIQVAACLFALLFSVFALIRSSVSGEGTHSVAELESELDRRDKEILKTIGKALELSGPQTAEKCRSLSVVDTAGKTRILLYSDDSTIGTGITIADDNGKTRLEILQTKEGQSLVRHYDRNGVIRAGSGIVFAKEFKEGLGAFTTFDAEGKLIIPNR